jgi:hypothetical protein
MQKYRWCTNHNSRSYSKKQAILAYRSGLFFKTGIHSLQVGEQPDAGGGSAQPSGECQQQINQIVGSAMTIL